MPVGSTCSPLRRESSTCAFVGWLSARWLGVKVGLGLGVKGTGSKIVRGGEPAHNATATMSPFWNCPTRWHHVFGGWYLAFCLPAGTSAGATGGAVGVFSSSVGPRLQVC